MEYLSSGGVDCTHKDFKELRYSDSLTKFNCNGKNSNSNGMITHGFKLKSAYENGVMPYTNYTFDFKVICVGHGKEKRSLASFGETDSLLLLFLLLLSSRVSLTIFSTRGRS